MATLYTQQESNIGKTWFLMFFMFALIMAVGWFLSYYYGNPAILIIAVIFSVGMNLFSYWFSDKVALAAAAAKPTFDARTGAVDPQFLELNRIVENLAITAGLPKPRVYIINDPAPNAFATGRNKDHSAIAVTTGLLGMMERVELEGVLAHEMSHIGNKDILISTIAVVLAGFLSIVSDMFLRSRLYGFGGGRSGGNGGGGDGDSKGGNILVIVGMVLVILSPIAGMLIQLAISRKREFLADATGALITRYPEGLARALEKIGAYQAPMQHATNATAHLYISNPFGAKARRGVNGLFMTHPPVEERVRRLREN
jgi:heat shock protein HtpX